MKRYLLLLLITLCSATLARSQGSTNLLPPTNFEGINPAGTDYVHLSWNTPIDTLTMQTPTNILGYNVYRDSAFFDFADTTLYYDLRPVLEFETDYYITAVYDIGNGQTGESPWVGPVTVRVTVGLFLLPYSEDFNTGLFTTNNWEVEGNNWQISVEEGNTIPCVELAAIPTAIDYSQFIITHWLDGQINPNDYYYLEFDLKLNTIAINSTEFLYLDLLTESEWINIGIYTNAQSFNWKPEFYDITEQATGNLFRIRFRAEGSNSSNIENWLIDNIHVISQPDPIKAKHLPVESIEINPNPASTTVFIDIKPEVLQVEIYNLLGNRIHTIKSNGTDQQIPLNVKNWKKGIYLVKYTTTKGTSLARKLVVN